jgi:hypothetical protein
MKKMLISHVLSSCLYGALCAKENGEQIVATQNATNLGYPVELSSVKLQVQVPIQVLVQSTYCYGYPMQYLHQYNY